MKVAYLTTVYPAVSHTFIRRELIELERQVGSIERFAIRKNPQSIVDRDDQLEDQKTFRVLSQPVKRWLGALVRRGIGSPAPALRGLAKTVSLAKQGHRGWLRHAAYYIEALLLLDEMKKRGVEHVHVHFGTNPAAVAQITHAMGGPTYSFTVHGPDEFDAPMGFALGSKLEDASFVVAISHYCSAQLRRWVRRDHWHKIKVVRCGVGEDFFQRAEPIDPSSRTLVCVGRLTAQKGQLLLLEAFSDLLERGVDARLVLVGDGEMRPQLEKFIAERGLGERVTITGWADAGRVRQELLGARALVLPSFAEGLPVVIMEAFAMGRPVLSTYVGGIPELVKNRDNGWLVPAGSREALTDTLACVMETPAAELEAMAARGRDAVRQFHSAAQEAAKLAAHILTTIEGPPQDRALSSGPHLPRRLPATAELRAS